MDDRGKSDRLIVPKKRSNKLDAEASQPESVEGRGRAKGNSGQQNTHRTQGREAAGCNRPGHRLSSALDRVRQVAVKDRKVRFTALWHHVYNEEHLYEAYRALKRQASPGVDGETWQSYGKDLVSNLQDLSGRLKRGAYRAKPVRRAYIKKPDGRLRPLGVTTLEDKIVQRATTQVLNAVYEADFENFSHGFRPGRSTHDASASLVVGIETRKVNWVLDADIRGFFDAIDHRCLIEFVEYRIADRRVVRHIQKWLNAGVLEDGEWRQVEEGAPQGGSISPLLSNIYLHYVLDLWAAHWRKTQARGDVVIVRYADDFVVGFEHRAEAERFLAELRDRFAEFNLELHPDKTRLLEFGRRAAAGRKRRGLGKPETFDFVGFTYICGKTRAGRFCVLRKTVRKRLRAKLKALKQELRLRLHEPLATVGRWLKTVVQGHYRYYGVPRNGSSLNGFRRALIRLWYQTLRRRSQKARLTWERMQRLMDLYVPGPRIYHLYPDAHLRVMTRGRSPVR
jgi:RNA-directed DNA polymerase